VNDILADADAWLTQCPSCDGGLPKACVCPPGDPRAMILKLVYEIQRLRNRERVGR
jgi:hypothetical protein